MSSQLASLIRHPDYYIQGADLSFLVEHYTFRVHRYFFERESTYFGALLNTPASPGQQAQGSSDSTAIVLDDVLESQFSKFLWVFYNPRYSIYEADIGTWADILVLSNRWGFPYVKELAVRELEQKEMLDVKRIKLYQANNVDVNLLLRPYAALCERGTPLSLAEGMDLGMETALKIAAGRELVRALLPGGMKSPQTPTVHGTDLYDAMREIIGIDSSSSVHDMTTTTTTVPAKLGGLITQTPSPTLQPPPPPPKEKTKETEKEKEKNPPAKGQKKKNQKAATTQPETPSTPTTKAKTTPAPKEKVKEEGKAEVEKDVDPASSSSALVDSPAPAQMTTTTVDDTTVPDTIVTAASPGDEASLISTIPASIFDDPSKIPSPLRGPSVPVSTIPSIFDDVPSQSTGAGGLFDFSSFSNGGSS